jgi:hypothetical protein
MQKVEGSNPFIRSMILLLRGDVAEWLRHGSAKPATPVQFRSSPPHRSPAKTAVSFSDWSEKTGVLVYLATTSLSNYLSADGSAVCTAAPIFTAASLSMPRSWVAWEWRRSCNRQSILSRRA